MEWYQIVATVYIGGVLVSFLILWFGLTWVGEDPQKVLLGIVMVSLIWMYSVPAFIGEMTAQRRLLPESEKIGKKKQEKEVI